MNVLKLIFISHGSQELDGLGHNEQVYIIMESC